MIVLASSAALFASGAAFGASVAHWYAGGGNVWGPLSASLLIAVIAAANLHRVVARPQESSGAGNSAA